MLLNDCVKTVYVYAMIPMHLDTSNVQSIALPLRCHDVNRVVNVFNLIHCNLDDVSTFLSPAYTTMPRIQGHLYAAGIRFLVHASAVLSEPSPTSLFMPCY